MIRLRSRAMPDSRPDSRPPLQPRSPQGAAIYLRMLRHGILLGFLFAIAGSFSASYAQGNRPACAANEASCRLSGGFSAVSVENPALPGVTSPSTPAFGALVYVDFVQIEQVARDHLQRAITMRESISPYRSDNDFDQYLRTLDYESGFSQVWGGSSPYPSGQTFAQIVNNLEGDLAKARDLYGFLAVFAPEARFRADGAYTASLCGVTDKENPNPPGPTHNDNGEVLPPVVDWCNFKARLRQSVREAANVRMIVGQEFMVDALGMNFSGNLVGGEDFVRQEVARLRAAQKQYALAEQFLTAGFKRVIGNGCFISDFYTDAEWGLLARATERQGTIQTLVGTRLSYLGVSTADGAVQAQNNSVQTMRRGANDGYIKLLGIANQALAGRPGCIFDGPLSGDALAEMALNVVETQRQAREIGSGRNVFGFDVSFTPARAYKSSIALNCETNAEATRGLWDEAYCSALLAQMMQERAENVQRLFDLSQTELQDSVEEMIQGLDKHIDNTVGCNRTSIGNDDDFFACARTQIELAMGCLEKVTGDDFTACMANPAFNQANDITTALFDLRAIYLEYQSIQESMTAIQSRITLSKDAKAGIISGLYHREDAQIASTLAQAAFDGVACIDSATPVSQAVSTPRCIAATSLNAGAQVLAGAESTKAEIKVVNAENAKEIGNLNLDLAELTISTQSAQQAFFAKQSDTMGILTALERDVIEAERQRAYFANSPANDPAYRIVRDSARLELAEVLERAAQMAYLAARRAEYEYAARLAASNFAISDIYRARTAQDILNFLDELQTVTNNLAGAATAERAALDLPRISVARDILLHTDAVLQSKGFTTPAAIADERTRLFREWVKQHTVTIGGEARLVFKITTSLQNSGLFDIVLPSGADQQWRLMLGGVGSPEAGNTGVSVNLVTPQQGLGYRKVEVTHGGMVHLRSFAGCIFNYQLMAPTVLLGLEWAKNQNPEVALDFFNANINDGKPYTDNNFRSKRFEGRPISSTEWQIEVRSGAPEGGLPVMDLQQLTDIELILSATYSPRDEGDPEPSECARVDY